MEPLSPLPKQESGILLHQMGILSSLPSGVAVCGAKQVLQPPWFPRQQGNNPAVPECVEQTLG